MLHGGACCVRPQAGGLRPPPPLKIASPRGSNAVAWSYTRCSVRRRCTRLDVAWGSGARVRPPRTGPATRVERSNSRGWSMLGAAVGCVLMLHGRRVLCAAPGRWPVATSPSEDRFATRLARRGSKRTQTLGCICRRGTRWRVVPFDRLRASSSACSCSLAWYTTHGTPPRRRAHPVVAFGRLLPAAFDLCAGRRLDRILQRWPSTRTLHLFAPTVLASLLGMGTCLDVVGRRRRAAMEAVAWVATRGRRRPRHPAPLRAGGTRVPT